MPLSWQAQRLLEVFGVGVKLFFDVAPGVVARRPDDLSLVVGQSQRRADLVTVKVTDLQGV